DLLAMVEYYRGLSLLFARTVAPGPDSAGADGRTEILRPRTARPKSGTGAERRNGDAKSSRPGGRAAGGALRGRFQRSAGQALCRLRSLAHRDGVARDRARA